MIALTVILIAVLGWIGWNIQRLVNMTKPAKLKTPETRTRWIPVHHNCRTTLDLRSRDWIFGYADEDIHASLEKPAAVTIDRDGVVRKVEKDTGEVE